jgi:hypothetical protein
MADLLALNMAVLLAVSPISGHMAVLLAVLLAHY